jgi:hypothetical protein
MTIIIYITYHWTICHFPVHQQYRPVNTSWKLYIEKPAENSKSVCCSQKNSPLRFRKVSSLLYDPPLLRWDRCHHSKVLCKQIKHNPWTVLFYYLVLETNYVPVNSWQEFFLRYQATGFVALLYEGRSRASCFPYLFTTFFTYKVCNVEMNLHLKMAVFWVVAPCSLVKIYRRFRGSCYLHHQGEKLLALVVKSISILYREVSFRSPKWEKLFYFVFAFWILYVCI